MKLTAEIKNRIDQFFDEIDSNDLFSLAVTKYGFKEDVNIPKDQNVVQRVDVKSYYSDLNVHGSVLEMDLINLAA